MKKLNILVLLASAILFSTSSTVYAFEYYEDKPLWVTYQNKAGYWFGAGPVQYLYTGWKTEERAIDLITHDGRWGHLPQTFVGKQGRCRVYTGAGKLESYDNSPKDIIRWMKKYKYC